MNDEIAKKLIEWFEAARTVAAEQVPDVAAQIVRLATFRGALTTLVSVALLLVARHTWQRFRTDKLEYEPYIIPAVIFGIFGCILLPLGLFDLGEALLAPKVVVLKYVGALR